MADVRPVLVVGDDDTLRSMVLELLMTEGYRVLAARNGAAGLDLAREALPAVILLDTQMPVLDGPGFLCAYRALPADAEQEVGGDAHAEDA